ncbi:MAG TPA: class II fructose-1,6-bisphosphate aldolase [Firmicutes bacterium]|nr:class II fructose-1,6-bisphosphate aldolase [Bacillota bacterium]
MALVTVAELTKAAAEGGYAVGAFNLNNMEILQAVIEAAEEERSPVILQASQGGLKYAGIDYIVAMARVAAENASVPIALNLDHGTSFEQAMICIRKGFSAVMIDGSRLSFDDNVALVKRVVDVAHAVGVSVEAELGRIGGTEDDIVVSEQQAALTDPDEAANFVQQAQPDLLAVAIGTAHGVYRGEPRIDFKRLEEIKKRVDIPLVLHGASGVPDEAIRRACQLGISKINIDTELRIAFTQAVRNVLEAAPNEIDPRKILGPAREAMKKVVKEKMRLFGSSGKA